MEEITFKNNTNPLQIEIFLFYEFSYQAKLSHSVSKIMEIKYSGHADMPSIADKMFSPKYDNLC